MTVKPVLVLPIIAAAVAAVFLASSGMLGFKDPSQILNESLEKSSALSEFSVSYNLTNVIAVGSESSTITGVIGIAVNNGSGLTSSTIAVKGIVMKSDVYAMPEGTFTCEKGLSGSYCTRYNDTLQFPNPAEQPGLMKELSEKGAVAMSSCGSRTIVGRGCDCVEFAYNPAKLFEVASLPLPAESVKEMRAVVCLDAETGVALEFEQFSRIKEEREITSSVRMIATSFSLDAPPIALPEGAVVID